jgi:hypothetical protein
MSKFYVCNLAGSVTSRALASHFTPAGEVPSALAVRDKAAELRRGFGLDDGLQIEPHPALRNGKARKRAVAGSPRITLTTIAVRSGGRI